MKRIFLSKPIIRKQEKQAVLDVLNSGIIASGAKVKLLEEKFAVLHNVKYAIAVSNGTTALHASLLGMGIDKGDKVITTPFSFIATSNSILFCSAKPVFADIDPKTFNLDPKKVETILKKDKNIKAILLVHLYGLPADMKAFQYLSKKYNVPLIEDCAQSIGASVNNKLTGSFGIGGCFSLYATKNITSGEGGMITTNNSKFNKRVRAIINHGRTGRFSHGMLGYNFRLTDIQAAIGLEQLKSLDEFTNKRIANAAFYKEKLKSLDWIELPYTPKNMKHVFHQFTILVPKKIRNRFIKYLNDNLINAAAIYPITLPEQEFYKKMGYKSLEVASQISKKVVCLPAHPLLTKKDLTRIVKVIKEFKI